MAKWIEAGLLALLVVFVGAGLVMGWLCRGLVALCGMGRLLIGLAVFLPVLALAGASYGLYSFGHRLWEAPGKL
jgi:hypothetical protein